MHETVETAWAKINLTLRVLGRRADGYHELESLVAFADVGDVVRLRVRSAREPVRPAALSVCGPFAEAIVGQNLVEVALRLMEQSTGRLLPLDLSLEKLLPVASGIGGGSADAAAALRAVRAAFPSETAGVDLTSIARDLGADVPACLASRSAIMSGVGERLTSIGLPPLDIVLVNACEQVPPDKTRRIFEALGAKRLEADPGRDRVPVHLGRSELLAIMRVRGNDLEGPASQVLSSIADVKAAVAGTAGCEIAVLSGAGPTIVGVYQNAAAARAAGDALRRSHAHWWIHSGVTRPR